MNNLPSIFARSLARALPGTLKSQKKNENGRIVQRPNKGYTIIFGILVAMALFFIFFSVVGFMTSISRESFEPFTIVFLLISILLIFLVVYYYKSLLKSYIIETDNSIIIGNFNDEQKIEFKDLEKVVEDDDNYKFYYNDKKYRVSKKVFSPDRLTEYIKTNLVMKDKGLLQNTYVRDNNSNDSVASYGKLDRNHKHYNLVNRINKDLEHVLKLPYQDKLEFVIEYISRMMDDPEFDDYFSNLYSTTMKELRAMKNSNAKYISYTRLIVDNDFDYNNLTEVLMNIASEYRRKIND